MSWKDKNTWIESFSTPSPVGRRIEKASPWYRRASLLGPQEGFNNGFQNTAKLGGSGAQFGVILKVLAALGHPKPSKIEPQTFQNRAKMVPRCGQGAEKSKQWLLSASWGRLERFLIDFRSQHGPKLAFKIEPWGVSWGLLGRLGASWRRPGLDFLAN